MVSPIAVAVIAAVVVLALVGAVVSWRRRRRAQAALSIPRAAATGAELAAASGTYLATTFADRPLDRVVIGGLGFRAAARVVRGAEALVVERAGGEPLRIPVGRVTGAGSGTWALDRGVEPGGLLLVGWSLDGPDGPVPVESAFRLDPRGQADLLAVLPNRPAPEVLDGRP